MASLESSEPSFTNPSFRSPPHSNKLPHFRAGHTQNDQSPFCGGNPCSHHLPTETRPRRRAPRPAPRGRTKEAPYFTTADSSGRSAPKSSQLSMHSSSPSRRHGRFSTVAGSGCFRWDEEVLHPTTHTRAMGLPYADQLGWCQGGQWGGIYGSPMECLGKSLETNLRSSMKFIDDQLYNGL